MSLITKSEPATNDTAPRKNFTHIYTHSGKLVDVENVDPEQLDIRDIAEALSKQCRYGGQCHRFYSVAEHSVLMSYLVPPEDAFAALMHDATEAYVVDVPRGVKNAIGGEYARVEANVWRGLVKKFGLPSVLPASVKYMDNAILLAEKEQIMHPSIPPWLVGMGFEKPEVEIEGWEPTLARYRFLKRFFELTGGK